MELEFTRTQIVLVFLLVQNVHVHFLTLHSRIYNQ
jgi:hypothetical protein